MKTYAYGNRKDLVSEKEELRRMINLYDKQYKNE